ncbi:MAG: hypothetical protein ACLTDX_22260, partial [[Clostridium] innocuum]
FKNIAYCPRIAQPLNKYVKTDTAGITPAVSVFHFHFALISLTYPPAFSDLPQYSLELLQRLFACYVFPSGDIEISISI